MTRTVCDRWGRLDGPDTDDPTCLCSMCLARRWDRLSARDRKGSVRP